MRRSDRYVSDFNEQIDILKKCDVVRLALIDYKQPYIVPLNFGYEANGEKLTLYFHSAREGRKIDIMQNNPRACFECDCSYKLTTGDNACSWSSEYESLIGFGYVSFVESMDEKKKAMDLIMQKHGFEGEPVYDENVFARVMIIKLEVTDMSGKRKLS